jgi:2-polyprenyl-3-methyl-5-hydroxy-6-metoxy-1,4-benzoquinol methylase
MKSINIGEYKNFLKLKLSNVIPEEYFDNYFNAFSASYYEIINTVNKDENILDVGCGGGLLVNYLDICGYRVEGFDNYLYNPHTKAINEIVNTKRLVKNSNIKDFKFKKKYDVIFMSNVIEHIDDWEENLSILINYLNPSGRIILLLPNYSVPVETHFMLPIVYNKEITYKIFKNKIINFEKIHNRKGIWKSLNFIKLKDLKKYFNKNNFEVKNDKEYFIRLIKLLIHNALIKNVILKKKRNLFHKLLIFLSKIFLFFKLFDLFKFLPISCHPYIKIIALKK